MARFNGGVFSKTKGKLAGIVFQQYEGIQVGREYQPNVKNPETTLQVGSRAAFKLASQFVSLYKDVLLIVAAMVSRYSRIVRGELVKRIRRAATIAGDNASLSLKDAVLAVNGIQLAPSISAPVIVGANIGNATINATSGDRIDYTIVAYDSSTNILASVSRTLTSTGTPQQIQAPFTPSTPYQYDIIAVATRALTEEGNAIYENLTAEYNVRFSRLVAAGDVAVSSAAYASIPQSN